MTEKEILEARKKEMLEALRREKIERYGQCTCGQVTLASIGEICGACIREERDRKGWLAPLQKPSGHGKGHW